MDCNTKYSNDYLKKHKGIYYIKCLINNKMYIGSTKKSFYKRWNTHIKELKFNTHHNQFLLRDWNKYKINNFEFGIIECVEDISNIVEIEYKYILTNKTIFPNGYNIAGYWGANDGINRNYNFVPEGCFNCNEMNEETYTCDYHDMFIKNCGDFYKYESEYNLYDLFGYDNIDKVIEAFLRGVNFNEIGDEE